MCISILPTEYRLRIEPRLILTDMKQRTSVTSGIGYVVYLPSLVHSVQEPPPCAQSRHILGALPEARAISQRDERKAATTELDGGGSSLIRTTLYPR